ncbi:Hypp5003 [Branchiostoma lanceolatum]|uniref:Hypp5003 protein n=1 Tax=Branchiostoma lanceolatum TaxID=7740 RepID=A0A8K0F2U2_BRALA|nr:Hypp5003 [Branchiostoma lanceolatum]
MSSDSSNIKFLFALTFWLSMSSLQKPVSAGGVLKTWLLDVSPKTSGDADVTLTHVRLCVEPSRCTPWRPSRMRRSAVWADYLAHQSEYVGDVSFDNWPTPVTLEARSVRSRSPSAPHVVSTEAFVTRLPARANPSTVHTLQACGEAGCVLLAVNTGCADDFYGPTCGAFCRVEPGRNARCHPDTGVRVCERGGQGRPATRKATMFRVLLLSTREANSFLARPRSRRGNAEGPFAEAPTWMGGPGDNLERECIEETCNREEAHECFENDERTVSLPHEIQSLGPCHTCAYVKVRGEHTSTGLLDVIVEMAYLALDDDLSAEVLREDKLHRN